MSVNTASTAAGAREHSGRTVDPSVIKQARAVADADALAIVLYGSQARGTADARSDIDVLQLVRNNGGIRASGNVNITSYSRSALDEMARRGSLFVLHLKVDSYVLSDPSGEYAKIIGRYRHPNDYGALFEEIRLAATVLRPALDTTHYLRALVRLGNYLLRTVLYAKLAEVGDPTFDLSAACSKLGVESVSSALALRRRADLTSETLMMQLTALEELVGMVPTNPHDSVEGLAIDHGGQESLHAQLFANVLAPSNDAINYAALVPPML